MSVTRWDPFQDLQSFRDELNRTLSRWFGREEREEGQERRQPLAQAQRWAPALDVVETKDAYRIDVEVPGLDPDEIEVTVDQGMVTIQGERRSEEETRDNQFHRIERRYGFFRRSMLLPSDVDASRVDASYDNGVLRLTVPKAKGAEAKRITVQSGPGATGRGTS